MKKTAPKKCLFFYFAYGSNMNSEQMRQRVPNAIELGVATLSNWRVVERKTADIEPHRGSETYGVLFALTSAGVRRLDAYEGHPLAYRRQVVRVYVQGRTLPAITYVMTPETAAERSGLPYDEAYRLRCWQGAHEHQLPNVYTRTSAMITPTVWVAVYGTLLSGERNAHVAAEVLSRSPCTLRGTLWDTGWGFPAFTPAPDGQRIEGECLRVTMRCLLSDLDRLEGYPHFYGRRQLPVTLPNGKTRLAWVYIMRSLPVHATPIPNGSWRRR